MATDNKSSNLPPNSSWGGKALFINLSTKEIKEETIPFQVLKDYIGGRGLGIYYLNRDVDPKCDPLGPENPLIFSTGALTGTGAATGSRYMVMTKSPLTGALTCSNSGGQFPTAMKKSGFDAVIIRGKAEKPVYIFMNKKIPEIRSAEHLWGKDSHETTDLLRKETASAARVSCIGPAGENLVLFSSIMNDKDRAAGRSGVGAVMGSKNLKAFVVDGEGTVSVHDKEKFKEFHAQVIKKFTEASKANPPGLRVNGTAGVVATTNRIGVLPTKNWQQGTFEHWQEIDGTTLTKKYLVRNSACFGCPLGCGRITKVVEEGMEGEGEGPEYETIYALGSNCLISNFPAIIKANYICNELGLDTISMGATVACAMELYDRGYINDEIVGQPLKWGDGDALIKMVQLTGLRKGFGNQLAEGSYRLASRYGHPELAIVSKKQEFPGYDPRGVQGMGLAYATSPIGGSHMRGDPAYFEIFGIPKKVEGVEWKGKAELVSIWQDTSAVIDSAGICIFFTIRNLLSMASVEAPPEGITEYLNATTGANYTLKEVEKAGERIMNAERLFLVRAGFSRKDDSLPKRLLEEPLPDGSAKGHVCHLDDMLDVYYAYRGWTPEGIPKQEKLSELGLSN